MLFLLCFLLLGFPQPPVLDHDTLVAYLQRPDASFATSAQITSTLLNMNPDAAFDLLHDEWPHVPRTDVKQAVLNGYALSANPRVLDVLDLGVNDPTPYLHASALQMVDLYAFAFQNFESDPVRYSVWRKEYAGHPLEDVLTANCRACLARFAKAEGRERAILLDYFLRASYAPTPALVTLRHDVMIRSGVPAMLSELLTPPVSASVAPTLQIVRSLNLDTAYLRRVVLPIVTRRNAPLARQYALSLLGAPANVWAAPTLRQLLREEYPTGASSTLVNALALTYDPASIPLFIALLDADTSEEGTRQMNYALRTVTGNGNGELHDAAWWRAWWRDNAFRFPAEVRALPLPKLSVPERDAHFVLVQTRADVYRLYNDPQRAYFLLEPTGGPQWQRPDQTAKIDPASLPGLLVALAPDGDAGRALDFWQQAQQYVLKGRYFVALPLPPTNGTGANEAAFVADMVKDIAAKRAINPSRCFLYGAGSNGMTAYTLSLQKQTPFRGFYLASAPFRSSQLPSLASAKQRRFLLQNAPNDKAAPDWMAEAARKLLTARGATVKRLVMKNGSSEQLWAIMTEALTWLESAKP